MKIRRSILFFIIIALALFALFLWHKRGGDIKNLSGVSPEKKLIPQSNTSTIQPSASKKVESLLTTVATSTTSTVIDKGEQIKEGLSKLNDANINFYGKVVDQFTNIVPDATVNFGVRIYNGFESTVKYGETKSDASGLFNILGYKGESLGLGVKKTGYVFVSMQGSGIYSYMWPEEQRAHPDKNNPVVIKMWKLQGAEPLVSFNKTYKLHFTNTPIYFDLILGQIVSSGGDVKVVVNRPSGEVSALNKPDWSITLEPLNGGIIQAQDKELRVTYEAPENGYQPIYAFVSSTNSPYKWFGGFNKSFFLKTRNGQLYSKASVSFEINRKPDGFMYLTFAGVANTNSSRNWEATAPQ